MSKGQSWTFGMHIRAARLRWNVLPLPGQRGLLRISDAGPTTWLCELRSFGLVPNDAHRREYYVFDTPRQLRETVEASAFLRSVREVKQSMFVVIGEDGVLI